MWIFKKGKAIIATAKDEKIAKIFATAFNNKYPGKVRVSNINKKEWLKIEDVWNV